MASPGLLAVDLDDVLMQTNAAAAAWHNSHYGTNIDLSSFYYYHWWKNPGWGTPGECLAKVNRFYQSPHFANAPPVAGAVHGIQALREAGWRIAIVTAREPAQRSLTEAWLARHFPGVFESIYYTGEVQSLRDSWGRIVQRKVLKVDICKSIGALLLIDDSVDNALECAKSEFPVLLFGDYPWGQRSSPVVSDLDKMSYSARRAIESSQWWEQDRCTLPSRVWRVSDWSDVIRWVQINSPSLQH